jgi:hypothetical protein
MKLFVAASAIIGSTTATDAAPSCDSGPLFSVVCNAETAQMTVTVDETCRQSDFSFIDFGNSFIQGDESVNTVAGIATGCEATEYLAATHTNEYVWTLDLNGDCVQDSGVSDEGVYVFYWKAVTGDVSQYATVPLECELSSVTVDSVANTITDQDITAINESFSDLSDKVKLTVSVSSSTDNPLLTAAVNAAGISYTEAATAEIGNHIQLQLENNQAEDVMGKYSMSLNQCWASKTNADGVDNIYDAGNGHILLWNEFCPQFPWVGPLAFQSANIPADGLATTNYLGEYWDTTGEIQTVHFRQFGWTVDGDDEVYYHCVVKVCEQAESDACAFYKLNAENEETTCTAQSYTAPSRKRRSLVESQKASVSAGIQVQPINVADCPNLSADNSICYGN